jgi:hypothetical protein
MTDIDPVSGAASCALRIFKIVLSILVSYGYVNEVFDRSSTAKLKRELTMHRALSIV